MQRFNLLLACFLLSLTCIAQQYPFVHYTPKDGLISNRITHIYQDREGRLYFTSFNGLSVYDGARFTNYTAENGLDNNIINCILEMGHDSIWVVTNRSSIYNLAKGKLKKMVFSDPEHLAIDNLFRDDQGNIYAASEQGIYLFLENKFINIPIADINGKDISTYISYIIPVNQYLLIQRDNSMLNDADKFKLYLYDTSTKKIIAQTQQEKIFGANRSPDGRIWVSTDLTILSIDTLKLKEGKIVLNELNSIYSNLKNKGNHFIFFDHEGNAWLTDKASALLKADVHGHVTLFGSDSGLSTTDVNQVFQDQENIVWIATNSAGVDKMVNSNFSFSTTPFGLPIVNFISYTEEKNQIWLYSVSNAKAISMQDNNIQYYHVENADQFGQLVETSHGLFGISAKSIYKIWRSGSTLNSKIFYADSVANEFIGPLEDQNGNLFLGGKYHLTVIINGEKIYQKKINAFVDYASLDTTGNIWTVSRGNELIMYKPQPADPANYLEQNLSFTTELSGIAPRSFVIDHYNTFWIGTRSSGVYAYQLKGGVLTSLYHLTSSSGLSENFVSYLAVDKENHIWACTPSGLDKISIRNGIPVVENLTKQNNIYQTIHKVVFDQDNTAWALFPNGLIKITPENKILTDYSPLLRMVTVKAGMDTVDEQGLATLTHQQNNLTFYFAAPTYLDEKQVLYTYRLQGRNTTMWSEPSSLAYASFIELRPGHYTLYVKASFPAGRYPEQTIQYKFYITPPWWQTNWFTFIAGICIAGFFVLLARYYYRRKLIIQRQILEKQQAIEKERTRIATDMHDDLGAGLSRIKFLSQSLRNKSTNDNGIKSGLEKITEFSDEMTEKMGEIVWALNEKNDTLADLVSYIRSYAVEYLSNHQIECESHTPSHLPNTFIPGEVRRNLFLAVKESLHNIVKHAGATHVNISVELNEKILIVIHDNGKGIDWDHQRPHANGLQNIRKRMFDIKGNADFVMDKGTKVTLLVPLNI